MVEVGGNSSRRVRRFGRGHNRTILPTTHSSFSSQYHHHSDDHHLSNTISCCYCDFKISALNPFFFSFGRKHARFLRLWFSIGTGFGLTALLGVTMILIWEFGAAMRLYNSNSWFRDVFSRNLFGFLPSPLVPGFGLSVIDGGSVVVATLVSVAVHEFGHAIAAASEGIQIQYIAVFLAVLFPGALVAFNYDLLQALPQHTTLHIYCAGIWHNAVFCAACALTLFLLPSILFPFYVHGQNPMVLDVAPVSPLSGYLSPGDVIVSVDGLQIRDPQEWMDKLFTINARASKILHHSQDLDSINTVSGRKGYCIPSSWVKNQLKIQLEDDQFSCLDGRLTPFSNIPCFGSNMVDDIKLEDDHWNSTRYCLNASDVVLLKKCGDGWSANTTGGSCLCSEDETCLMPVLMPGLIWVEIMYRRPYSAECLWSRKNSSLDFVDPDSRAIQCGGTFIFIGHALSIENSVRLTAYLPRWAFVFGVNLPDMLEKLCACTFHVSLTLALLNSLPVYLLDGESIMEVIIGYIPIRSHRKRAKVLQICLLGGTLLSILDLSRALINFL